TTRFAELRQRDVGKDLAAQTAGSPLGPVAVGELARAQHRVAQCLLRLAWDSEINCETDCLTRRTAGCGPACPVVLEEGGREASPYPVCLAAQSNPARRLFLRLRRDERPR